MINGGVLFYIVGEPGVGKSTLMAALTDGLTPEDQEEIIQYNHQKHHVPYIEWNAPHDVVAREIGYRREGHSGTDVLGLHMQPVVAKWMKKQNHPLVMGEGDRLASGKFFQSAVRNGYSLEIVWLYTGEKVAKQRRLDRGTTQNEKWLRGRATKVKNLVEAWDDCVTPISGEQPVSHIVADVFSRIDVLRERLVWHP